MNNNFYVESITQQTLLEVNDFINSHPNECVSYWDWRESLELSLKVYKELEDSTKEYGKKVDEVLEKYKDKDLNNDFYFFAINKELHTLGVIKNKPIHDLLKKLSKYHY